MSEIANLKTLAKEAAAEAYPLRVKRCWGWHKWTRWKLVGHVCTSSEVHRRVCLQCGRVQLTTVWLEY